MLFPISRPAHQLNGLHLEQLAQRPQPQRLLEPNELMEPPETTTTTTGWRAVVVFRPRGRLYGTLPFDDPGHAAGPN